MSERPRDIRKVYLVWEYGVHYPVLRGVARSRKEAVRMQKTLEGDSEFFNRAKATEVEPVPTNHLFGAEDTMEYLQRDLIRKQMFTHKDLDPDSRYKTPGSVSADYNFTPSVADWQRQEREKARLIREHEGD